jgi:hypothetical protein
MADTWLRSCKTGYLMYNVDRPKLVSMKRLDLVWIH